MRKLLFEIKCTGGCLFRAALRWINSGDFRMRGRYEKYYHNKKINRNMVLYESYFGRGMLCNPYAIFLQLFHDPQFKKMKHVWVLDDMGKHQDLIDIYSKYSNVFFVQRHSKKYLKYLCMAKYLINNVSFPNYFVKKKGQVYVNTWHGIPLKHLGYDVPSGSIENTNIIRNFLHTDYILSANSFLTEIYLNSYKLKEIYRGKIIEEGYPRLDLLFHCSKEEIYEKLKRQGVRVDASKKIILYAPTWRGATYKDAAVDISEYFDFKQQLEERIDTNEYQILIKIHQRVYELSGDKLTDDFFVPATIEANEILAVTDILVSDFSSIYFDFLTIGKPILFLIKNLEMYMEERGLYSNLESLPGPYTDSIERLARWINDIDTIEVQYAQQYALAQKQSNAVWNSSIAKKIVDIVFLDRETGYHIISQEQKKKHILIHRGKMLVNGMSTSLINLLDAFDYANYDVSVMVTDIQTDEEVKLINKINPNARVLYREPFANTTYLQAARQMYRDRHGVYKPGFSLYEDEFRRCYGDSIFDFAVDFDGYNNYYDNILLQCPGAVKSIWFHNDMYDEYKMKMPWLKQFFPVYRYFDRLVSCGEDVMLVNRKNFAGKYADYDTFTYAKNLVNEKDILNKKNDKEKRTYEGREYIGIDEKLDGGCTAGKLIPYITEFDEDDNRNYRFVAVGRLSPEKNYENLIHGFHCLYKENPNVYLYIVGGGILWSQLCNLIRTLGLTNHVILTGNIDNPISVMKNCDCFIIPSLHEGQPMVIHEARILHMPIICSEFSSANGIKIENGQYMIDFSAESICQGMKAFIDGDVPDDYIFDAEQYNKEAFNEFIRAITGEPLK